MIGALRFFVGTALVRAGVRLLGPVRDSLEREEEAPEGIPPVPVTLGIRAREMIERGSRRVTTPKEEPEQPLKGSLRERMMQRR